MKKEQLHIIKIGGNVINDEKKLEEFLSSFAQIAGNKILVHGGGKILDELAKRLDIPQQMNHGRRITTGETLDLALMVYAGLLNKKIVARLQASGNNAVGLSGADGNSILAQKRKAGETDFGKVGDVTMVNTEFTGMLLENKLVPVFCALTHDGEGAMLNTNADSLAGALAIALSRKYEVILNFCFEKKGVLFDPANENSAIEKITPDSFKSLKAQKVISNGMIPKLENAFSALEKGVHKISIGDAGELLKAIYNHENAGTSIVAD